MALRPTPAVTSPAAEDEARLAMLRSCGVLDVTPDAELDRWTAALRRTTGAAFTALCFADSSRRLAKSVCTAAAPDERVAGLALTESLESYVAGLARPAGPTASGHSYAEAPIAVDGYVLGQIGMAAVDRPAWSEAELAALADTASAVSTALALRLARKGAERVQQLVASHNTVHDLIARGAPLRDVLLEILESVERYDPSVFASLLMLDPTSHTLHSGLGPS